MKWIPADPAHENSGAHKRRGSRGIMGHGIDLKGSLPQLWSRSSRLGGLEAGMFILYHNWDKYRLSTETSEPGGANCWRQDRTQDCQGSIACRDH